MNEESVIPLHTFQLESDLEKTENKPKTFLTVKTTHETVNKPEVTVSNTQDDVYQSNEPVKNIQVAVYQSDVPVNITITVKVQDLLYEMHILTKHVSSENETRENAHKSEGSVSKTQETDHNPEVPENTNQKPDNKVMEAQEHTVESEDPKQSVNQQEKFNEETYLHK